MIISFYPGAGGNRFCLFLQGKTDFDNNVVYDQFNPYGNKFNRYLTDPKDYPVILTHNVNVPTVQSIFPTHREVYILKSDLFKSLRRQWVLFEQHVSPNRHPVGGPFSTIVWHMEYYKKNPYDDSGATVVDLDDPGEKYQQFADTMILELNSIKSPEFDFAYRAYQEYGEHAPIITLYNEKFKQ